MTVLGTRGGIISQARAVNGNGDIAGGSHGDVFLGHHGKRTDLGRGEAPGVNGCGESAGSPSGCPAFVISGGTRTTRPGRSRCAGGFSGAAGINHHHQIVGGSDNAQGYGHAVMWSSATITGPGTPGGTPGAGSAINDLGQVTGGAPTASEAPRVFVCSGGTVTGLGTFGPDPAGQAITHHGVIAGRPGLGAWAWGGGTVHDLSNLVPPGSGFTPGHATAINDNGQIAADGVHSVGQDHAVLPAPARASIARTMSLCAVGLPGGSVHPTGCPALCGAVCDPKSWAMARTRRRRTPGPPACCPGQADRAGSAGGRHRPRRLKIIPGRHHRAPGHAGFGPGDLRGRPRSAGVHRRHANSHHLRSNPGCPGTRHGRAAATGQVSAGVNPRNP